MESDMEVQATNLSDPQPTTSHTTQPLPTNTSPTDTKPYQNNGSRPHQTSSSYQNRGQRTNNYHGGGRSGQSSSRNYNQSKGYGNNEQRNYDRGGGGSGGEQHRQSSYGKVSRDRPTVSRLAPYEDKGHSTSSQRGVQSSSRSNFRESRDDVKRSDRRSRSPPPAERRIFGEAGPPCNVEPMVIQVAAASQVSKVAGAIAHNVRDYNVPLPTVSAMGPMPVNQAIKAFASSRNFLESENYDVALKILQGEGDLQNLFQFEITKTTRMAGTRPTFYDITAMKESSRSELAETIAGKVRVGNRVRVSAAGSHSVYNAVCALAKARKLLIDDLLDFLVTAEFSTFVGNHGEDVHHLHLCTKAYQL